MARLREGWPESASATGIPFDPQVVDGGEGFLLKGRKM
jgi:hypothetical protein